jgi:hypothetical protein
MILLPGGGSLFEITSFPSGSLLVIPSLALGNHSESKKKGETNCKIQGWISRVGERLVCSSMVIFNIWGETGFIK